MEKCDCLNDCGDDARVATGEVSRCLNYASLHTYDSHHLDAVRFRYLCETVNLGFVKALRRQYVDDAQFYRALSDEIDKRRAKATKAVKK